MVVERSKVATICGAVGEAGANYVLVGGQAVLLWGGGRPTRDIDLLIEPTRENARKVLGALESLSFRAARDLDPADVAARHVTMITDPFWRVDLMTVAWAIHYRDVRPRAAVFLVDGARIPTASVPDLIASKRSDRRQDALDIEVLEEILRRQRAGIYPPVVELPG